ncbi:MptD family putative ECF transporter S component [Deltaproteobacteria bacterium OttesenSCG-928-K17]|nr:MptD family putative ECF transporter S component [Deltaproteobacteria bacterium OttesenSCG-928-K17]
MNIKSATRNWSFGFETRDLVTIGLFAGAAKASTLMLALVGGGMNPLTMILKSIVFSALWVIMLTKVPKTGTLTLGNTVAAILGFFLLGQAVISLPALILATVVVEAFIRLLGGLERRPALAMAAVALSELGMRLVNVFFSYLGAREQPGLIVMVAVISAMSYLGILIGLAGGVRMVRELRHAGLIQN